MRRNPERLAWIVLLASFFTCIGLVVAVPLAIRHYILYSCVGQNVTLEVQRGPLSATLPGRGEPVAIEQERDNVPERTIVATEATRGRLVMHASRADNPVVVAVQLYENTEVVFLSARSPRFTNSSLPHKIVLEVRSGRVRLNVSDDDGRHTVVEVRSPDGTVTLAEGSYEVKVNGETTEITVRDGRAEITDDANHTLLLGPEERAISDGGIVGPLPAARNLIVNGDFQVPLDAGWSSYHEEREDPPGTVNVVTDEGRRVANFYRSGVNHAEVGIWQKIGYDVRDFTSLQMHLEVRIVSQDISGYGGCGYLGSECPIIVRLDYKDIYGTDREWLHGFYTGEPAEDWQTNWWAEQLQSDNWHSYDSANLMEELADTPPALIKSLTIYASGHSFHAMVTDVELLAQE